MGGKSLTQSIVALRLDLKDSGAVWSNAEFARCIEIAYSDLSRHLPREATEEFRFTVAVTDEAVTFPVDTDVDRIVTSVVLTDYEAGYSPSIAAQPDVPRVLTITLNDANISITGASFIVQGTDRNDHALTEHFHFSFGLHAAGESTTLTGKKSFKTVRSIEINQLTGSWPGDTLTVGVGSMHDVWIQLANKPIKDASAKMDDMTLHDDFEMDYLRGMVKSISGGDITTGSAQVMDYERDDYAIDISSLADLIRVQRVEYPAGQMPQCFVTWGTFANKLFLEGGPESEGQFRMTEGKYARVYYDAEHIPPNDFAPGTAPEFLESTVLMQAAAYALLQYVLKLQIQSEADLTAARAVLAGLSTQQGAVSDALDNVIKYLNNNSAVDAAGILAKITTDIAILRTAAKDSMDAANAYLDEVDTTDLQGAEAVFATYANGSKYLTSGTEPSVLAYLTSGDALMNKIQAGASEEGSAEMYRRFAQTVKDALISTFEVQRADWLKTATARTNAAMVYVQEVAQRLANLRTYLEEANQYSSIANTFAREAEARITEIGSQLNSVNGYYQSAAALMGLAERFRLEALDRRNEVMGIWRDRKQYIGDFSMAAVRQMPTEK